MRVKAIVQSVLTLHPGYSLRAFKGRLQMAVHIARNTALLRSFRQRLQAALGEQGCARLGVDCIGVVHWPYLSKDWTVAERLEAIASHYEVVARQCPQLLLLGREERLVLCELSDLCAGSCVVLDRAMWFKREGELVLNLFQGQLRVASLAFTLRRSGEGLCLFVGAVQGIHKGIDSETSLNIYRELTKDFEGLRPRSLLLEMLKCLARLQGVARIYLVSDASRHHRHRYFGQDKALELAANYDVIWAENGATPAALPGFYSLPLDTEQRAPEAVASKKRAMYRRRHALLEQVFARLQAGPAGQGASTHPSPAPTPLGATVGAQGD